MSAATTPAPTAPRKAAPAAPPDERFWQRHSPHHELPLSAVGSLTLHGLLAGGLMLGVVLALFGLGPKRTDIPFETVKVTSGGGGSRSGSGDQKGLGQDPKEAVVDPDKPPEPVTDIDPVERLDAQQVERLTLNLPKDDTFREQLLQKSTAAAQKLTKLDEAVRKDLANGIKKSAGKGGTGSGGGEGEGKGEGKGPGTAPGETDQQRITKREKRMLRWSMQFETGRGPGAGQEYLNQLRSLGAILAIPVTAGAKPEYVVLRDLKPGARAQKEDLAAMDCIYWVDDKPDSVRGLVAALRPQGLPPGVAPGHFIAFMPRQLEDYLYQIEKGFRGLDEDNIFETKFKVVRTAGGYQPQVVAQTPK